MTDIINQLQRSRKRPFGVSVILPAFESHLQIAHVLDSLIEQTLNRSLFEIILVVNGEDDGTLAIASTYKALPLHIEYVSVASASHARNVGLSKASFQFLTFVDADDTLSPSYLEDLLTHSSLLGITIAHLTDISPDGSTAMSPIEQDIRQVQREERPSFDIALSRLHRVLTMTTCKLIPTEAATTVAFQHHLRSAEDIVYFASLYTKTSFEIRIAPESAIYFRHVRPNSVSRQRLTYSFAVIERLMVIQELYSLMPAASPAVATMIRKKITAQWRLLERYAQDYPSDKHQLLREVSKIRVPDSERDDYHDWIYKVQSIDREIE
ncbi:glycosyltransferase family 2 protein [Exiguobacterium sp. PFWT01]|uniref:glycosyltransferase family 2 protein n=1 Tax=Exiguobacterium sp. PFWT01 TaxID=2829816 RepID=UPI001BA56717|nr:glycosyltransferase family 2 protein [Exiguobacterium sp. PFWT01]QUP87787.1 glycosyltransferase family 2 protein [Exiguobacterium sp. PFWT01]